MFLSVYLACTGVGRARPRPGPARARRRGPPSWPSPRCWPFCGWAVGAAAAVALAAALAAGRPARVPARARPARPSAPRSPPRAAPALAPPSPPRYYSGRALVTSPAGTSADDQDGRPARDQLADDRGAGDLAGQEQPARGLRVGQQQQLVLARRRRGRSAGPPSPGCGGCRRAGSRPRSALAAPSMSGTAARSMTAVTPLALASLNRCPSRPKPVTSVAQRDPGGQCLPAGLARSAWSSPRWPASNTSPVALCREFSTPMPSGLVSDSGSPGRPASMRSSAVRVGQAGDGHAVLGLGVIDAVPAGHVAAGRAWPRRARRAAPRRPGQRSAPRAASRAG